MNPSSIMKRPHTDRLALDNVAWSITERKSCFPMSLTSSSSCRERNKSGGLLRRSINFFNGWSLCCCDAIYSRVLILVCRMNHIPPRLFMCQGDDDFRSILIHPMLRNAYLTDHCSTPPQWTRRKFVHLSIKLGIPVAYHRQISIRRSSCQNFKFVPSVGKWTISTFSSRWAINLINNVGTLGVLRGTFPHFPFLKNEILDNREGKKWRKRTW